ncbi:MAG: hypothetical protein ACREQL_09315, partial [Candidatus Binatia bacterium]
ADHADTPVKRHEAHLRRLARTEAALTRESEKYVAQMARVTRRIEQDNAVADAAEAVQAAQVTLTSQSAASRSARINCAAKTARVAELKLKAGCADCGYNSHPDALEFDHVPGRGAKVAPVSALVGNDRAWPAIAAEIAKCDVVCANCHRIRTANRRSACP